MIIYSNTKGNFVSDVKANRIASVIEEQFTKNNLSHNNQAEFKSWENSLLHMAVVLNDKAIDDACKVAIEYRIPLTAKRVDFIITGRDDNNQPHVVIVELKQWTDCQATQRPDVVKAFTGGANRDVCHPSYQAYSYARIIETYNATAVEENVVFKPCAYLHNFLESNRTNIENVVYKEAISLAPVFIKEEADKLRDFIKTFIKKEDGVDLLMKLDNGKLKPSKALQDAIASMVKGNQEFVLVDEQKVAYETVNKLVQHRLQAIVHPERVKNPNDKRKAVVIVEGGPGTGKSVIAVQLLCTLNTKGYSATYVTKNAAPRNVYFEKLKSAKYKLNYVKNLFKGPDSFFDIPSNTFNCIIVDESHRLREKSGVFSNKGQNQIKELINAANVTVFFIDENQKVTTKDIGTKEEIVKWANFYDAEVFSGIDFQLVSQFRCNGSDGYLSFLDNMLQIRETANYDFDDNDYEVRLYASAKKLRSDLRELNEVANKSRMLAGYCYEWNSKENPNGKEFDVVLPDGFKAKWNFGTTSTWAIDKDSFEQVGCIHTSQGLEFDYCGVIIGQDLRYENGRVITDQTKEAKTDKTSGIRSCKDKAFADMLIRNTYRTLLSRGQKGCFIYCEDRPLLEHMSRMLNKAIIE